MIPKEITSDILNNYLQKNIIKIKEDKTKGQRGQSTLDKNKKGAKVGNEESEN